MKKIRPDGVRKGYNMMARVRFFANLWVLISPRTRTYFNVCVSICMTPKRMDDDKVIEVQPCLEPNKCFA